MPQFLNGSRWTRTRFSRLTAEVPCPSQCIVVYYFGCHSLDITSDVIMSILVHTQQLSTHLCRSDHLLPKRCSIIPGQGIADTPVCRRRFLSRQPRIVADGCTALASAGAQCRLAVAQCARPLCWRPQLLTVGGKILRVALFHRRQRS